MPTTKILLDCDTGIDDAMAILYLLGLDDAELVGISTVFGNVSAANAARNSLHVLELAGAPRSIPVAAGAERPIRGGQANVAAHVHGDAGLGTYSLPALERDPVAGTGAELIVRLARENPGELHLVATGPLTNLAIALALEPELTRLIPRITVMGGAADAPGNVTAAAEANILHDPDAAQAVIAADWDVTLVPLDVTMVVLIGEAHRRALREAAHPIAGFVENITDFYFDFFQGESFAERSSPVHDALAMAIAVGAVVPVTAPLVHVEVDCGDGPGRGQTLCDTRGQYQGFPAQANANCTVVLAVPDGFADTLIDGFLEWDYDRQVIGRV